MRDRKGTIIYVGKAISLRRRVQSYFRPSTLRDAPPKLRSMINSVADLETITVRNEAEALLMESNLIKQYRPRFNIVLRDDKRYLALRADPREPVPRLTTCRILRDDGAFYFALLRSRTVLDFHQTYGLRKCRHPALRTTRHCINDIIPLLFRALCGAGVCQEYRARFDEACAFCVVNGSP